ncbi:MAG: hypothetical protein WBC80_02655, partial [Isosphaeraceae bacterium]
GLVDFGLEFSDRLLWANITRGHVAKTGKPALTPRSRPGKHRRASQLCSGWSNSRPEQESFCEPS